MKLTFKDLKQQKFTLDAEPSDTIGQLKDKIFKHKEEASEWSPALQKLIYSGKILADDKTVESYKVEEKGFVVCMLAKPKVVPSVSTPTKAPSTPAQAPKPATPAAPAPAAASTSSTSAAPPETPSPAGASATTPTFNDPSALTMGAQREAAIQGMIEMGFPRDEIDKAMRAAFFNPDRAVEYLMTGIPEHIQQEQAASRAPAAAAPSQTGAAPSAASAAPAAAAGSIDPENVNLFEAAAAQARGGGGASARSGAGAGAGAGAGGLQGLEFLRNNPQFQQLRGLVQEAPHMLEPILQQVGQGNPQLAAMISSNPDAFLSLLSEGVEGDDDEAGPGMQTISVTPEEAQAIERLCALGFHRDIVIQAYIACDKNEELTANYLFDNPNEDEDMGGA
ncbi:XPC-binding domain-containing protein [Geopyxis carbonaria]|nr:XPC-binding domain-containing protein [Geopyxis carbonaria]